MELIDFAELTGAVVVGTIIGNYAAKYGVDWYYTYKDKRSQKQELKKINEERTAQGLESFLSWEEYMADFWNNFQKALDEQAETEAKALAAKKRRSDAAKKAAATKKAAAAIPAKKTANSSRTKK